MAKENPTPLERQEELRADHLKSGSYFNVNKVIEGFLQMRTHNEGDTFKLLKDPLFTGFKIFFHFDAQSGLLADESNKNSALAYLKRIGMTGRYELLKKFITTLSKLNSETPWIFQSIEGLQEIHNNKFSDVSWVDKLITITTLETIDWKVASLNQMYRNIAYDWERMVEILPVNLRRFSCSIYVYDFRVFNDLSPLNTEFFPTVNSQEIKDFSHIMYDLGYCEFDITSGNESIANVSNLTTGTPVAGNFVISFGQTSTSSLFRAILGTTELDSALLSASATSAENSGATKTSIFDGLRGASKKIVDNVKSLAEPDAWKAKIKQAGNQQLQALAEAGEAKLNGLLMGNVYGFSLADLATSFKSTDSSSLISYGKNMVNGQPSMGNKNTALKPNNVYGKDTL